MGDTTFTVFPAPGSPQTLQIHCFQLFKSCEVENVDFTMVLYVFLNIRFGGRSLILGNVGAILGLSWEDFGATWVSRGVILCHVDPSWGYLEEVWGYFGPPWAS